MMRARRRGAQAKEQKKPGRAWKKQSRKELVSLLDSKPRNESLSREASELSKISKTMILYGLGVETDEESCDTQELHRKNVDHKCFYSSSFSECPSSLIDGHWLSQ
jgi:hypothetical protein